jgi:hypothetical protein
MKNSDLTYILTGVFISAASFFYCLPKWFSITLPRYYTLEHTWKFGKEPGTISQGWYSAQLFAYVLAAVTTLVVFLFIKYFSRKKGIKLSAVLSISVVIVCMIYLLWHEYSKWGIL